MNAVVTPFFKAQGVNYTSQKFPMLNDFSATISSITDALVRLSQKFQKGQQNKQNEQISTSMNRSSSVNPNRMECEEELIKLGDSISQKKIIMLPLPKNFFKTTATPIPAPKKEAILRPISKAVREPVHQPQEMEMKRDVSPKVEKIANKPISKPAKRQIQVSSKARSQSVIVNRSPPDAEIVCNACGHHGPVQVGPQYQVAVPDITIDRQRDTEALKAIMANQYCEADMISPNYESFKLRLEALIGHLNEDEVLQLLHEHNYDEDACLYSVRARSENVLAAIEEINKNRLYRGSKTLLGQ